jgi:hypothetical protein
MAGSASNMTESDKFVRGEYLEGFFAWMRAKFICLLASTTIDAARPTTRWILQARKATLLAKIRIRKPLRRKLQMPARTNLNVLPTHKTAALKRRKSIHTV